LNDDGNDAESRELARAILRYLESYPGAKDTMDGIAQWWLLREWSERKLMDVQQAIELLLSEGLIIETRMEGLPRFYQVNPERWEEISKMLED
jgi:hypothetical protein